jgi:hypothetical protein
MVQEKLLILEEYRKIKRFSLNYVAYQKRKLENEQKLKAYDTLGKMYNALEAELLVKRQLTDSTAIKKEERFIENLRKDFQLEEAAKVILDLKNAVSKEKNIVQKTH